MGDFRPTASLQTLKHRAALLAAVRCFFDAHGYLDVETPVLSREIVLDAWLEPFSTRWTPEPSQPQHATRELFLQTSPEAAMKRLLAAGATAIFQISRVMRNAEVGRLHNPEFTMLEWYRTGDSHHEQMAFTEALVARLFETAAGFGAEPRLLPRPFRRMTYDEAFAEFAGTRVLSLSTDELGQLAQSQGIVLPPGLSPQDRDGLLNLLLAELVEPRLVQAGPVFLYDYPASQAALARIRNDEPPVAERFELYLDGVELCNGYHELTDADELRRRTRRQADVRAREGLRPLPEPVQLLAAMDAGLPPCAGVALGLDRLVMLALGATCVAEVIAFSFERA